MSEALSFDEVYRRYAERVFRFAVSLVHDVALAEDITSDTFASAFAAYQKVQPDPEWVHLWLFRIARNTANGHWRKERRREVIMRMLGQGAAAHGDVEQIVATNEALAETLRVLAKLKPRDRRLVALRVAAGLSNREVAEVMNLSEGTVGVAMHRALERFRALRAAARIEEGG